MNTDLIYNGYTTQPSDHECPDGDLSMSLNLIKEDSHLRPLMQPSNVLSLQVGERVLFLHHTPAQDNYILARPATGDSVYLYWMQKSPQKKDSSSATPIANYTIRKINSIEAVGNTLILAHDDDISYILWRDNSYIRLGSRPPFIPIDFGMLKLFGSNQYADVKIPTNWMPGKGALGTHRPKEDEDADLNVLTQAVYGLVNSSASEISMQQGCFHQPCFVRYAFRMFDGSYAWHSAPILLLPTVIPPLVYVTDNGKYDDTYTNIKLSLNLPSFALTYRILADSQEWLSQWKDIIAGIDIFVSAPLYVYDQSENVSRPTYLKNYLQSRSGQRPGTSGSTGASSTDEVFIGHYADLYESYRYADHTMTIPTGNDSIVIDISIHEKFIDSIRSASSFYKVAEIPLSDLKPMQSMAVLPLKTRNLTSLTTLPTLPDDYQSHFKKGTSNLYSFNSRINLGGVYLSPPVPFPIRSIMQFGNGSPYEPRTTYIRVWSRHNGQICISPIDSGNYLTGGYEIFDFKNNFPRYIFYPDASAFKMEIKFVDPYSEGVDTVIIDLTPHDFLNGAYWFNPDFQQNPYPSTNAKTESTDYPSYIPVLNKIYTSEVNNPFIFPVLGINTVGSGEILAIRSAVRALSQGQFGQHPLYAFTSEGIWALQTNASGTYSAIQPVSRDVCSNPKGITQIDNAVLFPADRGIMLISGAETSCISDTVNTPYPFDLSTLPALAEIHKSMGDSHSTDNCIDIPDFAHFISDCKMIYDYTHQHIIIFNTAFAMAFVFSLRSKQWGMMQSSIVDKVNSYPNALAVDKSNNLVDFSINNTAPVHALIVSRPIKLTPDVLKTVGNVIQCGFFRKGNVRSILYGSRDLFNWHLIWSSKDHYLRGFSGTPYKYYRIALDCTLQPDESVKSASIQFNPRLLDQPR